jgi:hypothetical protein
MTSVATCNTEDVILRGYVTADQINILLSFFVFPSIDGNQYSVTALGINQCDCIPTPTSTILLFIFNY